MNFIKRGLLSVVRKKGKSLILLAVIFILGNLISGAISIQQATGNVEKTVKERLGATATLEIDYEAWEKLPEEERWEFEFKPLELDVIKQVGELSYVKYYDYNTITHLGSDSLKSYQGEGVEYEVHGPSMDFMLKGINYPAVLDIEEQKAKLVDGRVFTTEEIENGTLTAIISKKLADKNNLLVGDTFALTNAVYDYREYDGTEDKLFASRDLVLEIIGLFEPTTLKKEDGEQSQDGMFDYMDIQLQNTVYVSNDVVLSEMKYQFEQWAKLDDEFRERMESEEYPNYYTPMYVLNNPENGEAFKEEVVPLLPELYTVRLATDQYDSIAGPMKSMSKLSGYVLLVSVIATILIIGLVVLLFLRDRKRELGIYLSLGERRGRVVGQILIEVMVIAVIGITLSLVTGNLLAQAVSGTMIESQSDDFNDPYRYYDPSITVTTDDVVESFEVKLDGKYILMFFGVGLLTILISTIIPLIYIVRLNPRKIMM
ncbi:MAG: ABC transporter permease [Anaerobacillus sp.]|uniref:ABC transporter permease n=1 Tax=Anaerobacillus sp. TaxID=1872506 RepID=UPI00391DC7B9